MRKPPIATIVNFCTNEARFIKTCIEQARLFSRQIIVPVCDHFFDATPENRELLESIYASFPDCLFIEYPYAPERIPKRIFREISPAHFWHSASRTLASRFLNDDIEMVLFLDADEVPDGRKFLEWLDTSDYAQHSVLKLANYWYFREPRFQANAWEDSVVLVQRRALSASILLHNSERNAIYDLLPGPKRRSVTGADGQPMFHHYSWVRTREEMIKKVESWGHRHDRDWKKLVEEEFAHPFKGLDFVHGYSYREYQPPFEISLGEILFSSDRKSDAKIHRLSSEEFYDFLELAATSWWRKLFTFLSGRGARE